MPQPLAYIALTLFSLLDDNHPVLQFGKTSPTRFTLDFKFPLSPLQAFGIALSSFALDVEPMSGNNNSSIGSIASSKSSGLAPARYRL